MGIWISSLIALISAVIGGVIISWIQNYLYGKTRKKEIKIDVLQRIMGYRYCLCETYVDQGDQDSPARIEMSRALNEAIIVFHSNKKVVGILKSPWDGSTSMKLASLIETMSKDLKLNLPRNMEDLIENPLFLPSSQGRPKL